MPRHTSREIILIHGSLTTVDPGDINATINMLKSYGIRCSVISLAAEVRACKTLTKKTGGAFGVILDDGHFRDLLHEHVEPPPMSVAAESSLIQMGFPQRNQEEHSAMCLCHADDPSKCKLSTGGYICPKCLNKCCELPTECKSCGLTMVSAPHLARSFLHIFPLDPFEELPAADILCFGCDRPVTVDSAKHVYMCKMCRYRFCLECDLFLHEILHSCPGCSVTPVTSSDTTFIAQN
ncbi:unnamed protein product [Allacma fusca]|uniref:C2H2-type domain-containing protein n=1 Tax=Allacma fusca TaxID=39272 RepID=A0A8J2K2S0_9HEXA|nr:unnamed protein product [Allacma fusca]